MMLLIQRVLLWACMPALLAAQATLAIEGRSGDVQDQLILDIKLKGSQGNVSGVQWTLVMPLSISTTMIISPVSLTAMGKNLGCSVQNSLSSAVTVARSCVLFGMNQTSLPDGLLASVPVILPPGSASAVVSLINTLAVNRDGVEYPLNSQDTAIPGTPVFTPLVVPHMAVSHSSQELKHGNVASVLHPTLGAASCHLLPTGGFDGNSLNLSCLIQFTRAMQEDLEINFKDYGNSHVEIPKSAVVGKGDSSLKFHITYKDEQPVTHPLFIPLSMNFADGGEPILHLIVVR